MWGTIIAVVGTLAGAMVTAVLQQRGTVSERANAEAERRRAERLDAVTALAVALSDHRRAMWLVGEARVQGGAVERLVELRADSHKTRALCTAPAVQVRLLVGDAATREAAAEAVRATYAMRNAQTLADLEQARAEALVAHDAMVDAAALLLAA